MLSNLPPGVVYPAGYKRRTVEADDIINSQSVQCTFEMLDDRDQDAIREEFADAIAEQASDVAEHAGNAEQSGKAVRKIWIDTIEDWCNRNPDRVESAFDGEMTAMAETDC